MGTCVFQFVRVDQIILLQGGEVTAVGSHTEMLAQSAYYKELMKEFGVQQDAQTDMPGAAGGLEIAPCVASMIQPALEAASPVLEMTSGQADASEPLVFLNLSPHLHLHVHRSQQNRTTPCHLTQPLSNRLDRMLLFRLLQLLLPLWLTMART